ncbi:MAG: pyridoxamine 5'-phosphate oxidase family protein [Methanobacterium sp.]|uniref:pyridoxamine 5'-phosphate oxidase family protein n=1 Tax=Methanobacterium sp. TaxID=2164 RepID=UPI003C710C69
MRRIDKEINNLQSIESILQEADHCVIALSHNNSPYMVPMNFGFKDNILYFHSSPEGRKIEILKINNKVSFAVQIKTEIVKNKKACNWGMKYMSVIGEGYAYFIKNNNEKVEALNIIMSKYSDNESNTFEYSETALNNVTLIKVEVNQLKGKISGYK